MLFGWPWNALIALGALTIANIAFLASACRFERRYVQPPEDPAVLQERQFADDVEAYTHET